MKKQIKQLLFLGLNMLYFLPSFGQQQIQFSQYIFNGLAVNPAYAGYRGNTYINSIYRKQWVNLPGAPVTFGLSVDGLAKGRNQNVGLGLQAMSDNIGPTRTTSVYGNYAFRIQLDNADTRRLCLGLGAGFTQFSLNGTVLQYVDNNDNTIPVGNVNRIVPDANFGMYYYTPKSYIGLSVMDILSTRNVNNFGYRWNDIRLGSMQRSVHMYFTAGTLLKLNDDVKLRPSFMWKEDFWGPSNVDLNMFLLLQEKFWVGASYRTGFELWKKKNLEPNLTKRDAVAAILEYIVNDNVRFGYAYDIMLNGLGPYQRGSHEFNIGFRLPRKDDKIFSPRYF